MNKALIIISLVAGMWLTSCSDKAENKEVYQKVSETAQRDADRVVRAGDDIFEQEKAILAIRVRENAMRDAGFDSQADHYIDIVSHILADSLHIVSPCH